MNKFSYWLWNINGILVFGLVATLIYSRPAWLFESKEDSNSNAYGYKQIPSWGSVLIDTKKFDTEKYEKYEPLIVATGTQASGSYMLTSIISADLSAAPNNTQYFTSAGLTNLLFSDTTGKYLSKLLDKPAYIHFVDFNANEYYDDTTGQYIAQNPNRLLYKISFEDTNQDGLINEMDMSALYISDVDGKNLKKLSPNNTACFGYEFVGNNREKIRMFYFNLANDNRIIGEQQFIEYDFALQTSKSVAELNKAMKAVSQNSSKN